MPQIGFRDIDLLRPYLRSFALIFILLDYSGRRLIAQRSDFGTVTGRVLGGDTQQPMRFVDVMLFAKPVELNTNEKLKNAGDSKKLEAMIRQLRLSVEIYQTKTDRDGIYSIEHVPTGDYYPLASSFGYLQPKSVFQAVYTKGGDSKLLDQNLNLIHVSGQSVTHTNLTLERGAAVSGKVLYDDGTPVISTTVILTRVGGPAIELPLGVETMLAMGSAPTETLDATTDDQGRFRIVGVPDGRFLLQTALVTHTQAIVRDGVMDSASLEADYPLMIFAPAAFRRRDAESLELHAPEERTGEDLTVDLGKLYSVTGQVESTDDAQPVIVGRIWLQDTADESFARATDLDSRGDFTFSFVPPGSYVARVESSRFKATSQPVVVSASDLVTPAIMLVPIKAAAK